MARPELPVIIVLFSGISSDINFATSKCVKKIYYSGIEPSQVSNLFLRNNND